MRIVCDWDLTVAPSDVHWLNYLNAVSGQNIVLDKNQKVSHYDLSRYFPDFQETFGIAPHSFWENPHLYDTMDVIPDSAEVINSLAESGSTFLIASVTKGGHISSKYRHIRRSLKSVDFSLGTGNGFFATKEKYLLPCDVAIDDRAENLVLFPDNVVKIYLNTIYADEHLAEMKKLPNVIVTPIENPWEYIGKTLR